LAKSLTLKYPPLFNPKNSKKFHNSKKKNPKLQKITKLQKKNPKLQKITKLQKKKSKISN